MIVGVAVHQTSVTLKPLKIKYSVINSPWLHIVVNLGVFLINVLEQGDNQNAFEEENYYWKRPEKNLSNSGTLRRQ